jgi:hypothetical protein
MRVSHGDRDLSKFLNPKNFPAVNIDFWTIMSLETEFKDFGPVWPKIFGLHSKIFFLCENFFFCERKNFWKIFLRRDPKIFYKTPYARFELFPLPMPVKNLQIGQKFQNLSGPQS